MESRAHAYLAITFLLLMIGGGAYFYYWLTAPPPENRIYRVDSTYGIGSLRANSEVRYKGLVVGHVKGVGFHPEDPDKVRIRIGIQPRAPITTSMYAQVRTMGLTGATYLALNKEPSASDRPLRTSRAEPGRIPMRQSGLRQVLGSAGEITERVKTLTQRLSRLVAKDTRSRFQRILKRTDQTTKELQAVVARIRPAADTLNRVLKDSDETISEARGTLRRFRNLAEITERQAREVGKAAKALRGLARTGEGVLTESDRRLLPEVEELAGRLQSTARSIKALTEQLEAQPSSLIYGPAPRPPGPGEPGFEEGDEGDESFP